ncbi:MAG: mechanosensitive ion channel [Gammaproteobacteria bacterium]|nr:mechanosensitive ion channel [Gammaproteobacteria bacterium]
MQVLFDSLPSSAEIRDFLNLTSTWWQAAILAVGMLLAKLIGSRLQGYLQTLIQTGMKEGIGRTALRTAMLALVPLLLWLWLIAALAILHRRGGVTTLLYPAMILAGALAAIRMGVFALRHSFSPGSKLKAWEGVLTITIWTLVALHILDWLPYVEQMLDEYAFTFGKVRISLYNVISFVLSIALMLLVALLAFEGSIRPGDVISFGNTFGTVKALHTRHVVIHTRDGQDVLVPNENLMTSDITNWSYEGDRRIRLRLTLQIAYDDDVEQMILRLERSARANKQVLADPAPAVLVTGFGDNGVNLELLVWIEDPEHSGDVRSELYRQIAKDFKAAGINLPFPQREVYLKAAPAAISPAAAKSNNRAESARDRKPKPKATSPD